MPNAIEVGVGSESGTESVQGASIWRRVRWPVRRAGWFEIGKRVVRVRNGCARSRAGDTGASFFEYIGMGALAIVVLVTLVASGVGHVFAANVGVVVCRITKIGGSCGAVPGRNIAASPVSPPTYAPTSTPAPTRSAGVVPLPPGVDRAANDLVRNLDSSYNFDDGQWDQSSESIGWWQSANALNAALDHDLCAGENKFAGGLAANTLGRRGNSFTNDYNDDTGWWALAFIRAYDLTGDPQYLKVAERNADKMWDTGHDDKYGGGLYWRDSHDGKNAITNELYIQIAAQLHNRIPGDTAYLHKAQDTWNWFKDSGMINSANMVNDGLDDQGHNNHGTTWTYNQGVILSGLTALYRATGDQSLLTQARSIADATVNSPKLSPNGILTEPCPAGVKCGQGDGMTFKGVFVRDLGVLNQALPDHPYQSYLNRQAAAVLKSDGNGQGGYGFNWAGPYDGGRIPSPALQTSALDALNAADCKHPDK
jgi:predicted alpha-1,6-mannanase (GH76 family)